MHADYDEVGAFLRIINLDVDVDVQRSSKETEVNSL